MRDGVQMWATLRGRERRARAARVWIRLLRGGRFGSATRDGSDRLRGVIRGMSPDWLRKFMV